RFQHFSREMDVPAAFDIARQQLKSQRPDLQLVRTSIGSAGVPEADINGIVWLFRVFRHFPPVVRAMDLWTMGGTLAAELQTIGAQVHEQFQGTPDMARVYEL